MISEETQKIVQERIWLINQLIEAKEHFRGSEHIQYLPDNVWTHPWQNYFALRNYLALTCFDILGQNKDWMTFENWLEAKSKKKERDAIVEKYNSTELNQAVSNIKKEYNEIYGVKNSFYHFIDKMLPDNNRQRLFRSILIQDLYSAEEIEDELLAKKFLYNMRNWFTHKGTAMGDPGGGIFLFDQPETLYRDQEPKWLFHQVYKDKVENRQKDKVDNKKKEKYVYSVKEWPNVLIEIIEDVIQLPESYSYSI